MILSCNRNMLRRKYDNQYLVHITKLFKIQQSRALMWTTYEKNQQSIDAAIQNEFALLMNNLKTNGFLKNKPNQFEF